MSWPTPAELQALGNAGGWVVAVVFMGLGVAAFVRGDVVPGWIHKREIARADKATDLLAAMTVSVDRLTTTVERSCVQTDIVVRLLTERAK